MNHDPFFRSATFALFGALALGACGTSVKVGNDGTGGGTATGTSTSTSSTSSTTTSTTSTGSTSTSGSGGSTPGGLGSCCGGTLADPPMCDPQFTCVSNHPDLGGTCATAGQNVAEFAQKCGGMVNAPAPLCNCHLTCVMKNPDAGGVCSAPCQKDEDCGSGICDMARKTCGCTEDIHCVIIDPKLYCDAAAGVCVGG